MRRRGPDDDDIYVRLRALHPYHETDVTRAVRLGQRVINPALAALAVELAEHVQRTGGARAALRERSFWLIMAAWLVIAAGLEFGTNVHGSPLLTSAIVMPVTIGVRLVVSPYQVRRAARAERANRELLAEQGG